MKKMIYIAGAYTSPSVSGVSKNIDAAIDAGEELSKLGYLPMIPHLCHWWDDRHAHDYKFWIDMTMEYMLHCDGVLRLKNESPGADNEVNAALCEDIPVYFTISNVQKNIFYDPSSWVLPESTILGDYLCICDTYIYYDLPLSFIAQNNNGQKYYVHYATTDKTVQFLYAPVKYPDIIKLESDESVYHFFSRSEKIYLAHILGDQQDSVEEIDFKTALKFIPEPDVCLGPYIN